MALLHSILITGGAGFIGHHLLSRLSENFRVIIVDNLSGGKATNIPKHDNVIFYKEDIRNKETISDIVKRQKINTCIHLAANTSVTGSVSTSNEVMDVNVNGTASVLEACTKENVAHFILASSAAVYGESRIQPVPEEHELRPISPYGESKVACENLIASYHKSGKKIPRVISLRFFNVYGEGQNPKYAGVITKFAERLSKGLPPVIYGDGMQTRDFVSVNDVVNAIILAMRSNIWGTFNVGTGRAITINELAKEMMNIFGLDLKLIYEKANPGEIIQSCANTKKSADLLKFVATTELEVGLRHYVSALISKAS